MFISFNFQKKDSLIIIGTIIYLIEIMPFFEKYFQVTEMNQIFLKILYQNLSKIIFYIPFKIFVKKNNDLIKETIYIDNKTQYKNFYNFFTKAKKNIHLDNDFKLIKDYQLLIFFIFITIADFLQIGLFYYDLIYSNKIHKLRIFFIISILYFNHWILNIQRYKHHIFSLIILGVYAAIVVTNDIGVIISNEYFKFQGNEIFNLITDLNQRLLLMIEIIGLKYLIDVKYISNLFIYFMQGIFELIFLLLFFLIYLIIKKDFIKLPFDYFVMIIDIIFFFIKNFITIIIIEKLNPCYIGLICSITNIPLYILYDDIQFIENSRILYYVVLINGVVLQIFAILVYSENIILNFCALDKDIKKNILIREEKEKETTMKLLYN